MSSLIYQLASDKRAQNYSLWDGVFYLASVFFCCSLSSINGKFPFPFYFVLKITCALALEALHPFWFRRLMNVRDHRSGCRRHSDLHRAKLFNHVVGRDLRCACEGSSSLILRPRCKISLVPSSASTKVSVDSNPSVPSDFRIWTQEVFHVQC